MLGVLGQLVPQAEDVAGRTAGFPVVRRTPEAAEEAEVVPEGALLTYSPAGGASEEIPEDFAWQSEWSRGDPRSLPKVWAE